MLRFLRIFKRCYRFGLIQAKGLVVNPGKIKKDFIVQKSGLDNTGISSRNNGKLRGYFNYIYTCSIALNTTFGFEGLFLKTKHSKTSTVQQHQKFFICLKN